MANEKNLKPCKKGETHNPKGRPRKLKNVLSELPPDMKEKVYSILGFALTLPDEAAARDYITKQKGELGQYGIILQIALKQLLKENWGFGAMMDIFDRLYGKPRQQAEVTHHADGMVINVKSEEERDKIMNIGNLEV